MPLEQQRMVKLFERIHSSKDYPGRRVGLALVKRAAERMGGSVGVESNVSEGS